VPAVREIFLRRFGAAKIESGGEFESIASGLALIGREATSTYGAKRPRVPPDTERERCEICRRAQQIPSGSIPSATSAL
jgi:hypothetical protein